MPGIRAYKSKRMYLIYVEVRELKLYFYPSAGGLKKKTKTKTNTSYSYEYVVRDSSSILRNIMYQDYSVVKNHKRYGAQQKEKSGSPKKKAEHFGDRTLDLGLSGTSSPPCLLHDTYSSIQIDMHTYVRIDKRDRNRYFDHKTKTAPLSGRRRERGEARRANSTPNGGPHLEQGG